jgi:hypothetical protein
VEKWTWHQRRTGVAAGVTPTPTAAAADRAARTNRAAGSACHDHMRLLEVELKRLLVPLQ